jgi:hypothetical protein
MDHFYFENHCLEFIHIISLSPLFLAPADIGARAVIKGIKYELSFFPINIVQKIVAFVVIMAH